MEALAGLLAELMPASPAPGFNDIRIEALEDEFGEDYTRHFLVTSADEIESLLKGLRAACRDDDLMTGATGGA